jgi:hypothetical protein
VAALSCVEAPCVEDCTSTLDALAAAKQKCTAETLAMYECHYSKDPATSWSCSGTPPTLGFLSGGFCDVEETAWDACVSSL